MSTTIKLRGGLAANWASVNPVLAEREMVVETDTYKIKIGDGTTSYNSLEYITSGAPTTNPTGGANNYAPITNPIFAGYIKSNSIVLVDQETDDEYFLVDEVTGLASYFKAIIVNDDSNQVANTRFVQDQKINTALTGVTILEAAHFNVGESDRVVVISNPNEDIFSIDGENAIVNMPAKAVINAPVLTGLQTFADNTAAAALPTGTLYKTSTGILMIKY